MLRLVRRRSRIALGALATALTTAALPSTWPLSYRGVIGWDVGVALYLVLAMTLIVRSTPQTMRERAVAEDDGAKTVLGLSVLAACVSVGAILAELAAREPRPSPHQLGLAIFTAALTWAFVHTLFAIHYAHEYENGCAEHPDAPPVLAGGLDFQEPSAPDYADFLYFAFTIGVAAQTADVNITRKSMRRAVLVHALVAFFFNTTVVSLSIAALMALL